MGQAPSTDAPRRPPAKIATTKPSPVWSPDGSSSRAPARRRPAFIVVGALLTLIALGFGGVFAFNLQQYLTVDAHYAGEPAGATRTNAIRVARAADLRRLVVYGPASAIAGLPGIVLLVLGLRKR
jgi:hypothetical protein